VLRTIFAFCDGGFNTKTNEFSFGLVLLTPKFEKIKFYYGKLNEPNWAKLHNVAGELTGAIAAIQYSIIHKYQKIIIFHDYLGISKWALNQWKRNLKCTQAYFQFIQSSLLKIKIEFKWIKAHNGNRWNEIADTLAKKGLKLKSVIQPLIQI